MTKNVSLPERLDATFLTSAPDLKRCPPIVSAEVAFAGRSNAGKSSVLNQLTGNRRTAKVSKPGRTQPGTFLCAQWWSLVDLPIRYAKAGKEAKTAERGQSLSLLSRRPGRHRLSDGHKTPVPGLDEQCWIGPVRAPYAC